MDNYHESVLVQKAVDGLHFEKGGKYIDCTAGNGGHMKAILEKGGRVLGIDLDPKMIAITKERLGKSEGYKLIQGNFTDIDKIA